MSKPLTCSKCGKPMEEGFVVDNTYGGGLVSSWVAGPPEAKFLGGVKITGRDKFQIRTYRCPDCGFLESYANK